MASVTLLALNPLTSDHVGFQDVDCTSSLQNTEQPEAENSTIYDDTSSSSMSIFNELPDPDQVLVIQRGEDTETFTCFPGLPIEIRLKIWRYSFPAPRAINLHPRCQGYCFREILRFPNELQIRDSDKFREVTVRHARVPLPIALQINRESRQETSMDYILVIRGLGQEARSGRQTTVVRLDNGPFCFDPTRDTMFLDWCSFRWTRDSGLGWISRGEHIENAKRISRLEVREMIWCRLHKQFLQIYNSGDLGILEDLSISPDLWNHEGPLRGLLIFSGPRSLHFNPKTWRSKTGWEDVQRRARIANLRFLGF